MKDIMIKCMKKYKWHIMITTILILVYVYLLTYPSKILGDMIDLLPNMETNRQEIINNTILLIGVCVLVLLVRLAWKYFVTYIPRAFEKDIKNKVFERLMKVKMEKLQKIKNGEIMSYFVKDINEIRAAIFRIVSYATRIVSTTVITTFIMMKNVDLKLTLVSLSPIVLTVFIIIKIKEYMEKSFRKAQINFTDMSEFVQESTDSIRTTKAYSGELEQLKQFIKKNKKVRSSNNVVDIYSTLLGSCVDICFGLCYGISILYGSHLVLQNAITVGDFVAFNGYIGLFVGPISWIPNVISRLKRAEVSYRRLDEFFALDKEKISIKRQIGENKFEGNIEIKDLTYHYPEYLDETLEHINLTVKKGETLGIIGKIGSGKTTLMNLIMKLYQVPDGKIFIDGKDINEIPLEEIRNNICYITQDNFLFSTTLKENITLFKDEYEEDEVNKSIKDAMIHDEIMEMPNGIHTVIGERGVDLSGGQKQRVVISRVFLHNSSVVIFDDTFSALDNRTEQKLLKNIKELTKDKSCIIISNRISDIKHSDHIIVLENGKIVEQGKHEELIDKQGEYYQFYKQQSMQTEETILV